MSLMRWHPLKDLEALRHQMNQVFDGLLHPESGSQQISQVRDLAWTPAIELKETDTDLILRAEVPGVEAKDLDVQVTENAVSIAGKHEEEIHQETKGRVWSELRYGQFQRWIPLPMTIQHEQVKADFKQGMLTLTLPKAEPARQPVVKLNLEEQLRDTAIHQRQVEEHRQQTLHRRAEDALGTMQDGDLDEAARETITQERQHEEHRQETAHMRATTGNS